jgi:16S rRNA (uracil1498-N3)-methyltransferase
MDLVKHWLYLNEPILEEKIYTLPQTQFAHAIQALRLREGNQVIVINGKGYKATATIINITKRSADVQLQQVIQTNYPRPKLILCIGLLKNIGRMEWFIEKATELGVHTIIPIQTNRTEKNSLKMERCEHIIQSAALQSQQEWATQLQPVSSFKEVLFKHNGIAINKYIAHCISGYELQDLNTQTTDSIILIGPEGDFTAEELTLALQNNYTSISLGNNRLRTETAALAAVVKAII